MSKEEIAEIVERMVSKGYSDYEQIKDSDDMYDASDEEKDLTDELLDELLDIGRVAFKRKYNLK